MLLSQIVSQLIGFTDKNVRDLRSARFFHHAAFAKREIGIVRYLLREWGQVMASCDAQKMYDILARAFEFSIELHINAIHCPIGELNTLEPIAPFEFGLFQSSEAAFLAKLRNGRGGRLHKMLFSYLQLNWQNGEVIQLAEVDRESLELDLEESRALLVPWLIESSRAIVQACGLAVTPDKQDRTAIARPALSVHSMLAELRQFIAKHSDRCFFAVMMRPNLCSEQEWLIAKKTVAEMECSLQILADHPNMAEEIILVDLRSIVDSASTELYNIERIKLSNLPFALVPDTEDQVKQALRNGQRGGDLYKMLHRFNRECFTLALEIDTTYTIANDEGNISLNNLSL